MAAEHLVIDTQELEAVTAILRRRADSMMTEAISEAQMRANTPFPRRPKAGARTGFLRGRRIVRHTTTATPAEVARWVERVLYHRFLNFWGDW
jgi:hypothetical protein